MAIRYYDEAITRKIKDWVLDPKLRVLGPEESTRLFQIEADITKDKPINLPLISISRDSQVTIVNTNKRALSYDGGHLENEPKASAVLNAIPIRLTYQLDIYTRYFEEADEYLRNFIFNFINYPKIHITIPYNNANIEHNSTIILDGTVSDNSNIPERLIRDQFYRMTLRLIIDDAYLFSVPFMYNYEMEEQLDDKHIKL